MHSRTPGSHLAHFLMLQGSGPGAE